jgi:hypothetical protein
VKYWLLVLLLLSCNKNNGISQSGVSQQLGKSSNPIRVKVIGNIESSDKDSIVILHGFKAEFMNNTQTYVYLEINGMRCLQLDSYNRAGLTCDWSTYKPVKE